MLAPHILFNSYSSLVPVQPVSGVSMLAPHILFNSYSSLVPVQPVSGVINKDCTEAECLYSSQCRCLSRDTDLQSCEGTGACELPTCHQPPPALQPVPPLHQIGPVHK